MNILANILTLLFFGACLQISSALAETTASLQDFGAKGDGTSDDGAALQAAINAVPVGGTLTIPAARSCYYTNRTLKVSKPLTVRGDGNICFPLHDSCGISITSGDVTIDGLTLVGPRFDSYHGAEIAICANGTFRQGTTPKKISNLTFRNTTIRTWGSSGILISFADNVQVEKVKCRNLVYNCIGLASVKDAKISNNECDNITGTGSAGKNAYCIFASRFTDDRGDIISQPRSENITITGNSCRNVPTWSCFDTHGGRNIAFTNNHATGNTYFCLTATPSYDSARRAHYAPLDILMANNTCDSGVGDASMGYGIVLAGSELERATGVIRDNSVTGYGSAPDYIGGVTVNFTRGVVLSGLDISDPSPYGIYLGGFNSGLIISGSTITDPFTNSDRIGRAFGIFADVGSNEFTVRNVSIRHLRKKAKYLLRSPSGAAVTLSRNPGNSATLTAVSTNATRLRDER